MQLQRPLDDIFATHGHVRVLRAMTQLPSGFTASARDLARRAGIAHTSAARALRSLARSRVVREERVGRAYLYGLSDRHVLAAALRALFAAEADVRSSLLDRLRTELPRRAGPVEAAVLFGSAARGEDRATSDIDVALISPRRGEDELEGALASLSEEVRDRYGTELNVIVRRGRGGSRAPTLWRRIEREGISLLPSRARRA
jgi:predicted nucleotidyltransferase